MQDAKVVTVNFAMELCRSLPKPTRMANNEEMRAGQRAWKWKVPQPGGAVDDSIHAQMVHGPPTGICHAYLAVVS